MFSIPGMASLLPLDRELTLFAVPGLVDDASQGVRRGKFQISGAEITQIFMPVLQEITSLVKGQVAATKKNVKAVLMVGGFGQNGYLRESLRVQLGQKIQIIVSPHGCVSHLAPS